MKKALFFLFIANTALAQTDSSLVRTDSLKTILKDDVIVSATRAKENSPTTYQFIGKEELNKNNLGQDLPTLLDNTPSVVTTSDAGAGIGYTGIRIRGSDATRVNVTLNGIPVNDAESQGTFWVDVPDIASSAQSVQIQRGVGSSTNGGSAFGGTVSVQTQSPSQNHFGEANVSAGSFGTFKINGKIGSGIRKGFFAEGSVTWITSDGYIDRASSNLISWFTQLGYTRNKTLIKLVYFAGQEKTYQAWNGVPQDSLKTNRTFNGLGTDWGQKFPPYRNQVDNYNQDYFQLLFAQQLPKHLFLNAGLFATLGHGYYEEYKVGQTFNDYFPNHDTLSTATDLVRQKWLQNIFYGGTWSLNYNHRNIDFTFGGLYGRYDGKHFGKVIWADAIADLDKDRHYYDGKSLKNDFNAYAKFNYDLLRKVNFYLDLQYRYVRYTTKGIDNALSPYAMNKQWHFFNPKAGLLYKIKPQHQMYASYAMGNREPNRDDVLAALVTGKEVKPETMHNVEAGYKYLDGKFPFAINYYLMQYKDQLVLTGKLNDVGNPLKENVAESYRMGVELNGRFIFYSKKLNTKFDSQSPLVPVPDSRVFSINYSFTYSLNKIKSFDEYIYTYDENYSAVDSLTQITTHKNTDIAFSPSIIAALELAVYPVKGLEISLMNKAVSKQYLDNTSNEERKLKPFFYSNLRLSYKLPLKRDDKEIKFTLLFNNIFNRLFESNGYTYSERYAYQDESNQTQVTPTSTYNYYYPQAGFNFLGGMSVRF
ncbi:MAG: TonB-dependent receptor [Bacteroidota bacterium]